LCAVLLLLPAIASLNSRMRSSRKYQSQGSPPAMTMTIAAGVVHSHRACARSAFARILLAPYDRRHARRRF